MDSNCLILLSDPMEGPPTSEPRVRDMVNLMTPEVAEALDKTNTCDRKFAHVFSAMTLSGSSLQHNRPTEEVIKCKVP